MAETLGSLFDKLSIVKLKQFHSDNEDSLKSLACHEKLLISEVDEFIQKACTGEIPLERITFVSNKVYKKEENFVNEVTGSIGMVVAQLASVNCQLWHEQEKVYEFQKVDVNKKDIVIKQLALLNLERNKCIDEIDRQFSVYLMGEDGIKNPDSIY